MNVQNYYVRAKVCNWKELPERAHWKEGLLIRMLGLELMEGKQSDAWGIQTEDNCYKIDASTICRRTALPEKSGKTVWENDTVKITLSYEMAEGYGQSNTVTGVICFDDMGVLSIRTDECENTRNIVMDVELTGYSIEVERTGSIFDAKKKAYEIGLLYDGRYNVITLDATDENNAVDILESMINTAKEYQVMHVKEKKAKEE